MGLDSVKSGADKTKSFGEWGDYTGIKPDQLLEVCETGKDDRSVRFIDMVPTKDWDPDTTTPIVLNGHPLDNKRQGRFEFCSPARARKPSGGDLKEIYREIICGEDFSIPVSSESGPIDDPFHSEPRCADLRHYKAVAIINKFSPFVRIMDPDVETEVRQTKEELKDSKYRIIPRGVCLVAFPTDYEDQLEDAKPDNVKAMMLALQKGLVYTTGLASKREGIGQQVISVFINTHEDTARSIPWLHTQAWVEWTGDGHGESMELWLQRADRNGKSGGCSGCNCFGPGFSEQRKLYRNESFLLVVPSYRETSHELGFYPFKHLPDMLSASERVIEDLADVLQKGSIGLTNAGQSRARHVEVYQRPVGYDTDAHWYGRITPKEKEGGFERMEKGRVSRYTPEQLGNMLKPSFVF